jgi:hypothetical protein
MQLTDLYSMLFNEEPAILTQFPDRYLSSSVFRHAYAEFVATAVSEKCPVLKSVAFERCFYRNLGTDRMTVTRNEHSQAIELTWAERS